MADQKNQRGLGRGLSALLADADIQPAKAKDESDEKPQKATQTLPIEFLEANPDQPRKVFKDEDMRELAESIGEKGVIQPILVRKITDERYQIVAGERRWRAASMAKLHKVPVIVRDYTDDEVAEIALIENIQRANLNLVEEAMGYQELINRGNTQEDVAKATGKPRSHVANMTRILRLPKPVKIMLVENQLTFGHAKILVSSEEPIEDAKWVLDNKATVRELEARLENKNQKKESVAGSTSTGSPRKDADTRQLEQELSANIGMKINIDQKGEGPGKLTIRYKNLEQLDALCKILSK